MMTIAELRKEKAISIKKMRKTSGLTQIQLSEISGISQSTISKLEKGLVAWSIDTELILIMNIQKFITNQQ